MSDVRADSSPADWYPDPGGRYELRYFNGTTWTADVSSSGHRYVDPIVPNPLPDGSNGRQPRNRLAVAGLVLGIVGLLTAWMPYLFVLGAIASMLAVAFGSSVLRRSSPDDAGRGPATAGLVTGALGCAAAIGGYFFTVALSNALDDYENPGPVETAVVSCVETEPSVWTATGTITNLDDVAHEYFIDVRFDRAGTDNAQRTASIEIDELQPGDTASFEVQRATAIDDIECEIGEVHGPTPFGIDFE